MMRSTTGFVILIVASIVVGIVVGIINQTKKK